MRTRKAIEKHFNFACLLLLAAMMISPAALKIYVYYAELKIPEIDVYTAVSIVGLELVFVYFFRVALHNFRGVKAQILQLDLRIALLQFIQSYVKFSGDARKTVSKSNGETSSKELTLDRFEQVIFSGLVTGENELPSTFDGLDGLAKIIEKVKGESTRIIAAGLAGKQNTPLHFLLANSPRLHLLDAALRFGSWQEGPDASAPAAKS